MEMANLARINDTNEETRAFYSHLASHCVKLRDFSVWARQTSSRVKDEPLKEALAQLGSIVSENCLQQLPSSPTTLEFRLGMLNLCWSDARKQSLEMKLKFISRWLTTGEQRAEVDKALESCADELDKQHPDPASRKSVDKLPSLDIAEPSFAICKAAQSILDSLLDYWHHFFTKKTKRILSLVIGSTILHLNGTSWLQRGWGSASIEFFQTTSSKTPLRPFLQTQLPKAVPAGSTNFQLIADGGDTDDEASDDRDLGHRYPVMVALTVVLMEEYFVMPLKGLAEMHDVPPIEVPSGRMALINVDQVFNGDEEMGKEGCRAQMPEDCPLRMAIDNCLDGELWEDEEGEALDSDTLRSRIYQHVVWLLELHLIQGLSQMPLDGVNEYARDIGLEDRVRP
ncbi:uncharacterized protein Triagg1_3583 [Trichoderma aggressivum f. europaeum]|uniref:DUF7580 domain-containing protein n=1 Tax=Trichoderma aggressivum f. europaeum TaxID=173218 RepID=A0AAE1IHH4_9HYPO|nr:hypothetical protein Triagg1_3583 [Trichoderma aggressivum f. europaeum]